MPPLTAPADASFARRILSALGLIWLASTVPSPAASGTVSDPLPEPADSGLSVGIIPWLTLPASSSSSPKARLNHLKPCPGDIRLFCNDLRGKLWSIDGSAATAATLYLDLADHFPNFIHAPGLGTGFASFAFHPEFHQPGEPGFGRFYTAHSELAEGPPPDFTGPLNPNLSQLGIITEWSLLAPSSRRITLAPPNFTRREILRFGFPYNYHDLQEIEFDPTAAPGSENYGCLFLCLGDGGSVVIDLPENIGRIDSPLGTILRIAPVLASGHQPGDFLPSANGRYFIPAGPDNANPHVAAVDPTPGDGFPVVREIYAHGFRNPHRISWDTGGSGKMFCGNIGESRVEEVELVTKGSNHGWPLREGSFAFHAAEKTRVYPLPESDPVAYTYPVSQYDHDNGRCALVGGYVYRGTAIPYLRGHYVFGDIVSGELYITPVAEMNHADTTATAHTPAPARTLRVKSDGVATTFRSILGASRADLRFGIDHDGEIYLLSKQNGTLYRLAADGSHLPPPPAGTASDWFTIASFEEGTAAALNVSNPGSAAQVVNDPAEGPVNRVLRIRSAGTSTLSASLPIPPIPDGTRATVFFRFYLVDQDHDANWGLSERSAPSTAGHFRVRMRSAGNSGSLEVRDNTTFRAAAPVKSRTWYSVWLDINHAAGTSNDRFDVYLQGGEFGVPSLVQSGAGFSSGTTSDLQTFFWRMGPGTEMYFDDLHVDPGHVNLTDPRGPDWQLVDTFEDASPLDDWRVSDPAKQSISIVTEPSGNHYLRRAASSGTEPNPAAIAALPLPFETEVGQTLTLFFRLRLEGGNLRHSFGATALRHSDPSDYSEDDFAPQLLLHPAPAAGTLHLYDGPAGLEDFVAAPVPPLETGLWYKVWIVANNRGAASGGQVWQAYVQGGVHHQPVALGPPLHFRRQTETPLTHFLALASSTGGEDNHAIHLDDLHAFAGLNLLDPLGPVWQPLALERENDNLTLGHPTTVNRAFQLFESADLKSWQPLGPSVEGDAGWREFELPIVAPRRFFQAAEMSRRDFHASSWSTDFPGPDLPAGVNLLASSAWSLQPGRLALTATGPQVAGMVARPCGHALLPGDWRNSTLVVEARTLQTPSVAERDLVLIFGYVDETRFCYARLSSSGSSIHKIDGTATVPIHTTPSPAGILTSDWHTLRLEHQATGAIAVYADGAATPVVTASDTTYPVGRLGIGSYDDPAEFRRVSINGEKP